MATTTTNLGLTKPVGTEQALISVINGNMDIIDTKVGAVPANKNVQGEIDALSDQIAWKFGGDFGGSTSSFTIPTSDWKEGAIEFLLFGRQTVAFTTHILKNSSSRHYTAMGYLSQKEITDAGWGFTPQEVWVNFSVDGNTITFLSCDTLSSSLSNWYIGVHYR